MTKKSQPPLVILLDVLFIFLFVAILESPPKITYELPPNKLFKGGVLMTKDPINGQIRAFDFNTHSFITNFAFPNSNNGLYFSIPCGMQEECLEVKRYTDNSVYIAISGKTYDDISRLTFIGCNIDPSLCSNIHFTILEDGNVDIQELINDNSFFTLIDGF